MCPDSDQRAERFDEAWERRRTGEEPVESDPELEELLEFASWLDENLPEDIPDPEFRANLKEQLLNPQPSADAPVDLAEERWYRRLTASRWRVAIGVSAVAVIVIVSLVLGMGRLENDDPSGNTAFLPTGEGGTPPSNTNNDTSRGTDDAQGEPDWDTSELPPLTAQHVVVHPLLNLSMSIPTTTAEPAVELDPNAEMPDLPDSAPIYYLSAPQDLQPLLAHFEQMLGIEAELVRGDIESGTPYQLLNESGEAIVSWDAGSAYFSYYADAASPEFSSALPTDASPKETARAFLETIGFDLYSIEYEARVEERGDVTHVTFKPLEMPDMGMDFSLGASVDIDGDGAVKEAHGFWFSLMGSRETALHEVDEAWARSRNGEVFWPPHDAPTEATLVEIETAELSYLLTRYDEETYVLQPAVTFMGEYGDHENASQKKDTRCYVSAAEDG